MFKINTFIPKEVNVGYSVVNGTSLNAGFITHTVKSKIRREGTWDSIRDLSIQGIILSNVPRSGFSFCDESWEVFNWRTMFSNSKPRRVFIKDPSGFGFEITGENLADILRTVPTQPDKGFLGEFVYGFDKEGYLVLVSVDSPVYSEMLVYSRKSQQQALKPKDLKVGHTYLSKDNQKLVYLGKHVAYKTYQAGWGDKVKGDYSKEDGHQHFFRNLDDKDKFLSRKGLNGFLIEETSAQVSDKFDDYMKELEFYEIFTPIDRTQDEFIPYSLAELQKKFGNLKINDSFNYYTPKSHLVLTDESGLNKYVIKINPTTFGVFTSFTSALQYIGSKQVTDDCITGSLHKILHVAQLGYYQIKLKNGLNLSTMANYYSKP